MLPKPNQVFRAHAAVGHRDIQITLQNLDYLAAMQWAMSADEVRDVLSVKNPG
jgi:hypothetical protein